LRLIDAIHAFHEALYLESQSEGGIDGVSKLYYRGKMLVLTLHRRQLAEEALSPPTKKRTAFSLFLISRRDELRARYSPRPPNVRASFRDCG